MSNGAIAIHTGSHVERVPNETTPGRRGEDLLAQMMAVLDWLPVGVLCLQANATIIHANRQAERYLGRARGIRRSDGKLRCERSRDSASMSRALVRVSRGREREPVVMTLGRTDAGRALELMILPEPVGDGVVVLASDPTDPPEVSRALARRLHGLSEREAEVASAVVAGMTLDTVARGLRVEKETVRSHLKRVFSKTQTSRQAQLVRLFSIGLLGLGHER